MGAMASAVHRLPGASATAAALLLLAGCGKDSFFRDPSGEPIKATLRTTIPLAYAASVAMAAVSGSPPPNAFSTTTCSSFPCAAVVTIAVDDRTLPLAFGSPGNGQILVAGLWTSKYTAILTVAFVDMFVGNSVLRVRDVSAFPVAVTPAGLHIVYASIDVNVGTGPVSPQGLSSAQIDALFVRLNMTPSADPAANVGLDAWVVQVGDAGTPHDFSDDRYTVMGGGEYVAASSGSGSILQIGMAATLMAPGCALNPVEGLAVLNEVGTSKSKLPVLATALIIFEQGCTGTARVTLATGNWVLAIGKAIPLRLDSP
jgi:hypothetical protein